MGPKPLCFLDLGEVVFHTSIRTGGMEVRPGSMKLVRTIHDVGFDLRVLSGDERLTNLFMLLAHSLNDGRLPGWNWTDIQCAAWDWQANYHRKSEYIAAQGGDFIWIEDHLGPADTAFLVKKGIFDRYCHVQGLEDNEFLVKVIPWVKERGRAFKARAGEGRGVGEDTAPAELGRVVQDLGQGREDGSGD